MRVERFNIEGIFSIIPMKRADHRGFFSETYSRDALAAEGVAADFVQDNHVYSAKAGVLRGLHFQIPPRAQGKLIRCTRGAIWDVIVDLRRDSPSFKHWHGVELSAANRRALYVPEGFAQGFVTLSDNSEVLYLMSQSYRPDAARGVRWDDPAFGITWPIADPHLSERDRGLPLLGA